MSFSLVINQSNLVPNGLNTAFEYRFLNGNFKAENMEVCVTQATIPYSWFNISASLNNNTIEYNFNGVGAGFPTTITIPDGFYTIDTLNLFLQQTFISNGQYLINADGEYVYFVRFLENQTYYANQIVLTLVPSSLPAGWTQPSGFYGYPAVASTGSLSFPSNSPYAIIGVSAGTIINSDTQNVSFISTITPVGSKVNAIIIRSNFVSNNIVVPSDILDSLPIDASFGSNINYTPSFPRYLPIADGTYGSFRIELFDEELDTIKARDGRSLFNLHIRKRS